MQPPLGPLVVHPLEAEQLPVVARSSFCRSGPARRASAVGHHVDEGVVVVDVRRVALAPAEGVEEFEVQAGEEGAVGGEAGADDGHGGLQLRPHVGRRQGVCATFCSCQFACSLEISRSGGWRDGSWGTYMADRPLLSVGQL